MRAARLYPLNQRDLPPTVLRSAMGTDGLPELPAGVEIAVRPHHSATSRAVAQALLTSCHPTPRHNTTHDVTQHHATTLVPPSDAKERLHTCEVHHPSLHGSWSAGMSALPHPPPPHHNHSLGCHPFNPKLLCRHRHLLPCQTNSSSCTSDGPVRWSAAPNLRCVLKQASVVCYWPWALRGSWLAC